jgi:hypothetical protein
LDDKKGEAMTEPTIETMTREVFEWLHPGAPWHAQVEYVSEKGRVLLLQEAMLIDGFGDYLSKLSRINYNQCLGAVIPVGYITDIDNEGLLLKAVYRW